MILSGNLAQLSPGYWAQFTASYELLLATSTVNENIFLILANLYLFLLTNENNFAYVADLLGCFSFFIIRMQPQSFYVHVVPMLEQRFGKGTFLLFLEFWIDKVSQNLFEFIELFLNIF